MRKTFRSVMALLMVCAMAFGFAACGSTENGGETSAAPSPTAAQQDEYVYSAKFTTLAENDTRYLYPRIHTDDGFYATSYEKVGEDIPEGAVLEYEGQYDVYQTKLFFIGYDGSIQELTEYTPCAFEGDSEGRRDYSTGSDLAGIAVRPDGKLVSIDNVYESWSDAPEDLDQSNDNYYNFSSYNNNYYIRVLDESGRELSCARINTSPDSYIYAYGMVTDADGNAVISEDSAVRVVAPDGSDVARIELEGYADSLVQLADGRIGVTTWGDTSEKLEIIDIGAQSISESFELPDYAYNLTTGGGDYDVYFSDGSYLCGFKLGDKEPAKLLNWINCDINGSNADIFNVNADGSILLVINTYDGFNESYTTELAVVSKVPASSLPAKQTLTLATQYLDWDVRNMIVNFNRKSEDCRIQIIDYSGFNTEDDYTSGATKLTTELLAGNVPDIIDLNGLPYTQLAAKGILEDLYPFIDGDSEFSRSDFFENVFKALEVNGKLYSTCASFSVQTLIGAASVVGDRNSWTFDELNEALANMPEGCEVLDVSTTRDDILSSCLSLDLNSYVDWGTGKCSFDNEQFKQMLKFASQFPESFDWENYEWSEENNSDYRISQGMQMLMQAGIYSVSDIRFYDAYFGGDASYIGYPTLSGTGSMFNTSSGFAMSAACANKELAWNFLREFFTEKTQASAWALPTNRNVFNKLLEKEMTPEYKKDAEGNYLLDDNGEKIEISKGGMGFSNGQVYEFYALTQEQADELIALIESTDKVYGSNDKVYEIVSKHAAAYFAGDKSLDDTAKLIQSEANIYINEQR